MVITPRAVLAAFAGVAALWLGAGTAQAAPYEPNDSFLQAVGPLNGGQDYEAAIETSNDVDWFYFNTVGQRQLDISATALNTACDDLDLYSDAGTYLTGTSFVSGRTMHILRTAPASLQYALRVGGHGAGCQYRIRIDPADAISTSSPGIVAWISGGEEADDVQRVLVDGVLVGSVTGNVGQSFTLGPLSPTSRIVFEALNSAGEWSWDVDITNQSERVLTTLFTEDQSGGYNLGRFGHVRRVVLTPSGNPVESCGEAIAPVTCIPSDKDGDGAASDRDCNDADKLIGPGAAEIIDNAVDENCDGVAAKRVRRGTTLTAKRSGTRYSGRIDSADPGCVSGRRIVLRRQGRGTRAFATATTSRRGTYSFRRTPRLRGRVYVVAAAATAPASLCLTGRSRIISG